MLLRAASGAHTRNARAAAAEYFAALRALPQIIYRLPFRRRSLQEELQEVGVFGWAAGVDGWADAWEWSKHRRRGGAARGGRGCRRGPGP